MIGADAIRGHIDLILLAILEHGRSYAYEISKTLERRSSGEYTIKQTTLYTAVKRLQAQGLLDAHEELSETGQPRSYYALTAEGHEQLALKRDEWRSTRALVDQFAVPTEDAQPSPAAQPSHEQDQVPS